MKVYILVDMEGISGIRRDVECNPKMGRYFTPARRLVTAEVNAAVEGCVQAGAETVVVNDSHWEGFNVEIEDAHPAAAYESPEGAHNPMPSLDETFDGLILIGAHAMAGTENAFLDHTQSSLSWHDYYINGKRCGEIAQAAAIAGHYDVPLLFVSGDVAACREAEEQFPGVETVAVKEAIRRNAAKLLFHPEESHRRIREGIARALQKADKPKPWKLDPPIEVMIELNRSDYAESYACRPGVERVDARTVKKTVQSALEIIDF